MKSPVTSSILQVVHKEINGFSLLVCIECTDWYGVVQKKFDVNHFGAAAPGTCTTPTADSSVTPTYSRNQDPSGTAMLEVLDVKTLFKTTAGCTFTINSCSITPTNSYLMLDTALPSSYVNTMTLTSSSPKLYQKQTQTSSYTVSSFTIDCTFQTFASKVSSVPLSVSLVESSCTTGISVNTLAQKQIAFGTSSQVIGSVFSTYFTRTDPMCVLGTGGVQVLDSGCSVAQTYVTVAGEQISAINTVDAGYTTTVCIKITVIKSGISTVKTNTITINQLANSNTQAQSSNIGPIIPNPQSTPDCQVQITNQSQIQKVLQSSPIKIPYSEYSLWFKAINTKDLADTTSCRIVGYILTDTTGVVLSQSNSNSYLDGVRDVVLGQNGLIDAQIKLTAITQLNAEASKLIQIHRCGKEEIIIQQSNMSLTFKPFSAPYPFKLTYNSSDPLCPISKLSVLYLQNQTVYNGSLLQQTSPSSFLITPQQPTNLNVYFHIETVSLMVSSKVFVNITVEQVSGVSRGVQEIDIGEAVSISPYPSLDATINKKYQQFVLPLPETTKNLKLASTSSIILLKDQRKLLVPINTYQNKLVRVSFTDNDGKQVIKVFLLKGAKAADAGTIQITDEVTQDIKKENTTWKASNVTAEIESVTSLGVVTIRFSTDMKEAPVNITETNQVALNNTINITLVKYHKQFNWTIIEFKDDELKIKLNFSDTYSVSEEEVQDTLVVNLTDAVVNQLLISSELLIDLNQSSWILEHRLRRQMVNSQVSKSILGLSTVLYIGLKATLISTFILSRFMIGAMYYFFCYLNQLLLVIHLPMFRIIIPANVVSVFEILVPIYTFDVLDPSYTTELLFTFDPDQSDLASKTIFQQTQDLGYDSFNSWMILGSLNLYFILYILRVFLYTICAKKVALIMPNRVKKMRKVLFFEQLIEFSLDSYLLLVINSFMVFRHPFFTTNGEVTSFLMAVAFTFIWVGFVPCSIFYVLRQNIDKIQNEKFKERWGGLYSRSRLNGGKWPIAQPAFFCGRLIVFYFISETLVGHSNFQIMLMIAVNLFYTIYMGSVKPMETRGKNRLELMNDWFVFNSTLLFTLFTDWVLEPESQYNLGFILLILMALNSIVNLIVVWFDGFRRLKLIIVKYSKRLVAYRMKVNKAKKYSGPSLVQVEQMKQQQPVEIVNVTFNDEHIMNMKISQGLEKTKAPTSDIADKAGLDRQQSDFVFMDDHQKENEKFRIELSKIKKDISKIKPEIQNVEQSSSQNSESQESSSSQLDNSSDLEVSSSNKTSNSKPDQTFRAEDPITLPAKPTFTLMVTLPQE